MGYKVILSTLAEMDLQEIVEYISNDKPDVGERVGKEIIAHLRVLEKFPRFGRVVPEFREEILREIIHSPYRIVYEVNDSPKQIEVIRVWHGARGTPEIYPY